MARVNGTTTQRGYGAGHQRERERWRPIVERGEAICWRCDQVIDPAKPWHLGHDDQDRRVYRGPEHPRCNTAAGARKTNRLRRRRGRTSRRW